MLLRAPLSQRIASIIFSTILVRAFFYPYDLPITHDGNNYFSYALDTSILSSLPTDYTLPNNGWPVFLSLFFKIFQFDSALEYMDVQRVLSIIISAIIGFIIAGELTISLHDLFLGFLAGFFQIGFGFILITVGSQTTPAAVVGILMLTESVFGPLWAWLFINEIPPFSVIIGGSIIIFSILFQSIFTKKK